MQRTATPRDTAKHPLKPTHRRPPRTQRQRWYLVMSTSILAAIVAVIIIGMVRSKKKGKSSCGCGCANCAMADACHQNKQKKQS